MQSNNESKRKMFDLSSSLSVPSSRCLLLCSSRATLCCRVPRCRPWESRSRREIQPLIFACSVWSTNPNYITHLYSGGFSSSVYHRSLQVPRLYPAAALEGRARGDREDGSRLCGQRGKDAQSVRLWQSFFLGISSLSIHIVNSVLLEVRVAVLALH